MTREVCRLICAVALGLALAIGCVPPSASALDTANVLMNIDGMVINHQGLFRNFTPADGAQTFSYGTFQTGAGSQGKYKSFALVIPGGASDLDGCCISHRIMLESWGPQTVIDQGPPPVYGTVPSIDISNAYYPVIDRAGYGTVFDPSEYQIEVKFKPFIGVAGIPNNAAKEFNVSMDRQYGFAFNAQKGIYERSLEQINYSIGVNSDADYNQDGFINNADRDIVLAKMGQTFTLPNRDPFNTSATVTYQDLRYWDERKGRTVTPINDWYATAPKDANGFATWTVPLTSNVGSGRSTNIEYGNATFRDENTVTGGGRFQNPANMDPGSDQWEDTKLAFNGPMFGGGPSDPSRPGSKLNTPNGVNLLYFGKNARHPDAISLEVLGVAIKKINPGSVVARIDENSGLSARFGSGFTRGANATPISIPGDGVSYLPPATDQISRFDANGMTNLIFNMRTPDNPATETHRFLLRYGPGANTFVGTNAMVNVRARLTEALGAGIAQTLTLVAKDLDGNDNAATMGADEFTYNLALNQFNTSTFTTVSVPLSAFSLSPFVARNDDAGTFGSGPAGFLFAGDGSIANFNLYEFGGLLAPNSGLLKLELDYMEIRLPSQGLIGDYNNNGTVDAADYAVWRNNVGAASLPFNRDPANVGVVGASDYESWKSRFGTTNMGSGSLANTSVPEPATLSLLAFLLAAVMVVRPRH